MSNRFESFSQSRADSSDLREETTGAFQRTENQIKSRFSFHVRLTHIEQSFCIRLSFCNENTCAGASTRMKRMYSRRSVSIFPVCIMSARASRNPRNYKAHASCAFQSDSQYSVMVHSSLGIFLGCCAALIERLPVSGVSSATLVRFFIAVSLLHIIE